MLGEKHVLLSEKLGIVSFAALKGTACAVSQTALPQRGSMNVRTSTCRHRVNYDCDLCLVLILTVENIMSRTDIDCVLE